MCITSAQDDSEWHTPIIKFGRHCCSAGGPRGQPGQRELNRCVSSTEGRKLELCLAVWELLTQSLLFDPLI